MTVSARKRIWGWWFFDWASQPYATLLLTFVFGPYFAEVARAHFAGQGMDAEAAGAAAQAYWGWGQTVSGVLIACLAPILGAVADQSGRRMLWIWIFSACYVVGAWMLWNLAPGEPDLLRAMVFFGIGLIGMEFATIFTNSLMPGLAGDAEMGRVSGSGFAFGYLGGIISLAIMLVFFVAEPSGQTRAGLAPGLGLLDYTAREDARAVGPFTALWYAVFMVPFFLWVREPRTASRGIHIGRAMSDLWQLLKSLKVRRSLAAYLLSSMFYRDALNALYAFGGVYASGVLGWSIGKIGLFGVVAAVSAALFSWLGGKMDSAKGPKPVIMLSMVVLIAVCLVIAGMSREAFYGVPFAAGSTAPDTIFYICGIVIGAAGGTLQASSRTMMVFHTSAARATEAFGLYALSGKATAFVGPFSVAVFTTLSGSQRIGIAIPLIALFLLGMLLLSWVNPRGER
ncbi:MFS transporter [Defluviimonas sp. WL0024]|uniref:MFS transporter n=1 Tax=Albidovulum salinarum TaxID=2984153 RepID=A0ABT2X236_9RHOB|nr:MFS transporter [Defluviimonas sp. WL0024]MCU9848011.1 MFS transporter [Defluviimonas sp. WL0024]